MKSFLSFFLEYSHDLADGTPAQTIKPHNGKDPNRVGPDKKNLHTVGPYQKENNKLNIPGSTLTYPELEEIGLKTLMDIQLPMMFQNVKNSGANVLVSRNRQGDIIGRVIKHSQPDK